MFNFAMQQSYKFINQVRVYFVVLTFFTLIQAALTIWVAYESDYHIEKGRVSNRILTEFIDLGGNKQRLKVWLAQYLLTNDSSIDVKNNLIFKMNNSLSALSGLLTRDQGLSHSSAAELLVIDGQIKRYETLKVNIEKLAYEVNKIDKNNHLDPGQAWKFMIQVFDSLDGNDLRKLINDAIEIQKLRATEAETSAKNYITYFNTSVYILTGLIVLLTLFSSILIQRAVQEPIESLVKAAVEFSKGNMSYRIQKMPKNEFGILASKFNEMALELEKSRLDEIQKRSEIEQAVNIRTQELKYAVDKLQKAEFERKIFLSNISHELKTPATAILGEASVTLRGLEKKPQDYISALQSIQTIGRQLAVRIDDLLLLARSDSDFFRIQLSEIESQEVDLFVQEALQTVDVVSGLDFNKTVALKGGRLLLDKDRFVQMLVILLDNAARYNYKNQPIDIKLTSDDVKFTVQVTNLSENVSEINFDQIFERYYRSRHARIVRPDGLGIGLHLAQTIVKSHYGTIKAEPVEDRYFRVTVEIPVKAVS